MPAASDHYLLMHWRARPPGTKRASVCLLLHTEETSRHYLRDQNSNYKNKWKHLSEGKSSHKKILKTHSRSEILMYTSQKGFHTRALQGEHLVNTLPPELSQSQ